MLSTSAIIAKTKQSFISNLLAIGGDFTTPNTKFSVVDVNAKNVINWLS